MAKTDKEFTRRLKKIDKHLEALYSLVRVEKQESLLHEISNAVASLREEQKAPVTAIGG